MAVSVQRFLIIKTFTVCIIILALSSYQKTAADFPELRKENRSPPSEQKVLLKKIMSYYVDFQLLEYGEQRNIVKYISPSPCLSMWVNAHLLEYDSKKNCLKTSSFCGCSKYFYQLEKEETYHIFVR